MTIRHAQVLDIQPGDTVADLADALDALPSGLVLDPTGEPVILEFTEPKSVGPSLHFDEDGLRITGPLGTIRTKAPAEPEAVWLDADDLCKLPQRTIAISVRDKFPRRLSVDGQWYPAIPVSPDLPTTTRRFAPARVLWTPEQ